MVCLRTALARRYLVLVVRAVVLAVAHAVAVSVVCLGLPATALASLVFVRVPRAFIHTVGNVIPIRVACLWCPAPLCTKIGLWINRLRSTMHACTNA